MTERLGRADLHVHTLASDGTSGVEEILAHAVDVARLDVIAVTDHERIDAALAARALAKARKLPIEIVVGEEVTTRGGHLLALFIEAPIRPLRSLRSTIAAIHRQGGLAIPAHPLVPYPLCAQAFALRRLLADPDPAVHPDGLETFNPTALGRPWHGRVVRFADEHGLAAVGSSDAHTASAVGTGHTSFPGRTAEDLRLAILARRTHSHGEFHDSRGQLGTFALQLRKYGRDARDEVRGRLLRNGTGRDHGYPGGRLRPPRYDETSPGSVRLADGSRVREPER
ncbi:MAG TPA: PHP-associated domain-containing protein [Candidatus Limnocylindria bacterium]|nr:PHP-associated domain-containing protein [Candidatus Limnocylindria bacterium]